jgi:hypothetical protein
MNMRHLAVPFAVLLAVSAQAQNDYFFVSGNVMTGLTWHAPQSAGNGSGSGCQPTPNLVQFFSAPFYTDTTASNYSLHLYFESFQTGFVYVYQDGFNPQDPCVGIHAFGTAPLANIANIHLDANRQYFVVTSEDVLFGGGGSFQVLVNGPTGSHLFGGVVAGMTSPVMTISLSTGGTQPWILAAGPGRAGQTYWVVGSLSGTVPGIVIDSTFTLPLNPDFWLDFAVANPNTPPLIGSLGTLDSAGQAQGGGIGLPPGLPPSLAGLRADHAFVALDAAGAVTFVSNPVPLLLVP